MLHNAKPFLCLLVASLSAACGTASSQKTGPTQDALACEHQGHDIAIQDAVWTSTTLFYLAASTSAPPGDIMKIEVFFEAPYFGPSRPGTYLVTGANYQDCGLCILAFKDCESIADPVALFVDDRYCAGTFFADEGSIEITAVSGAGEALTGIFSNIVLREVTIDPVTFVSTPVPHGSCWDADGYAFDVPFTR